MNKLNKELIGITKQLNTLTEQNKTATDNYKYLQDKLHLYLDSPKYTTTDTEKYIIKNFWSQAYKTYTDGGYITNDAYVTNIRFKYETIKIKQILKNNCKNFTRALDIGCGDGRYTKKFAKHFGKVVGIDLSKQRVDKNNKNNTKKNVTYLNEDFITMHKDSLGTFDFVFVGDIFMYTCDEDIKNVYVHLLKLLKKDGILIVRESTLKYGELHWKSKNYVAYYRNKKFYKKGIFKENFQEHYRNHGYSLYYLDKYFNVNQDKRASIKNNPMLLEKIVEDYVDKHHRISSFYMYKV